MRKHRYYWTEERVFEEAKKYNTKAEFKKNNTTAYYKAIKNKWIDNMDWLIDGRVKLFTDKIDCVYKYYFEETNSIYVGRTIQRKTRHNRHIDDENDAVAKHARENGFAVPQMEIIEDNLTIEEGQKQEIFWINFYKEKGYNILNKNRGGAIGTIAFGKWTKEKAFEEAKKYRTKKEFQKGCSRAYQVAWKNNWLKDFTHFLNGNEISAKNKTIWTYEKCEKEALKYKTKKDFREKSPKAYCASVKHKYIELFSHFQNGRLNNPSYSKPISQYSLNGELIATFSSAMEAQRQTGVKQANLLKCCKNMCGFKSAGGFKWKYA